MAERRGEQLILGAGTIALAVALWALAVRASGTSIFPSPLAVGRALVELMRSGVLWGYIRDSIFRVGSGYGLAVLTGIPTGMILGWYGWAGRAFNPVIQLLRPISPLAWMPLAVVWFGVSNVAPIFLIFLASFFPIVVASMNAVHNISPAHLRAGRNFGLGPVATMRRVILPAMLPSVLVGLRLALGIAWVVVVAAEMIAVNSGLGYLIIDARNAGKRYDLVVGGMILIGCIGLILDIGARRLEHLRSTRWGFREG